MGEIVCPYCFDRFKRRNVLFRCASTSELCPQVEDKQMKQYWRDGMKYQVVVTPKKSISSILFGKMPQSAKCTKCNRETTNTICPNCHNALPREMVEKGGFIISIIGARSSGKTNYITTLINELQQNGHLINLGISEEVVGRRIEEYTSKRYENDFFNPLYKGKTCHAPTDRNDSRNKIPLIYKLFSTRDKKQVYLVFYDTAGENFIDPKAIEHQAKFLKNSDGIIFLLDTFNIPYVHEKLKSKFNLGDIEIKYDGILSNLLSYFDGQKNKEQFYAKPLALAFTKIDALLKNEELFLEYSLPNLKISSNSEFLRGNGYSKDDIAAVDLALKAGLAFWGEVQFMMNVDAPSHFKGNTKYFGVSALGDIPVKNKVQDINPYRVMDPLIWILDRLKFPLKVKK